MLLGLRGLPSPAYRGHDRRWLDRTGFEAGYPTDETAQKLIDEFDYDIRRNFETQ